MYKGITAIAHLTGRPEVKTRNFTGYVDPYPLERKNAKKPVDGSKKERGYRGRPSNRSYIYTVHLDNNSLFTGIAHECALKIILLEREEGNKVDLNGHRVIQSCRRGYRVFGKYVITREPINMKGIKK